MVLRLTGVEKLQNWSGYAFSRRRRHLYAPFFWEMDTMEPVVLQWLCGTASIGMDFTCSPEIVLQKEDVLQKLDLPDPLNLQDFPVTENCAHIPSFQDHQAGSRRPPKTLAVRRRYRSATGTRPRRRRPRLARRSTSSIATKAGRCSSRRFISTLKHRNLLPLLDPDCRFSLADTSSVYSLGPLNNADRRLANRSKVSSVQYTLVDSSV